MYKVQIKTESYKRQVYMRVIELTKFLIQFVAVFLLFIFSIFFAWYEGSTILDNPREWKYSTPFSKLLNGEVHSASDVS